MKKGQELMEPTVSLMTTKATRLAVLALSLTAVSSMPAIAFSTDARNENASANVRGGGASHSAAKPSAPARSNNAARPAQSSARPAAASSSTARSSAPSSSGRATTASHSTASRPAASHTATGARPNSAKPNTAKASNARPAAGHANAAHDDHRSVARGADHGRADRGGHADARNDHRDARNDHRDARGDHRDARGDHRDARNDHRDARGGDRHDFRNASYSHATNLRGGREIPGDRFGASFGHDHPFHIGHPVMIGGQASFSFGGFWFGIVDPWPVAWAYSDPVYVDLVDGGYVLVNELHPGVTVAVSAGDPAPATCPAADAPAADPAPVATAPVATVRPVVVAYTPFYTYFTWHYWGPHWHHYWR